MNDERNGRLGIDDLLENDLTSYEYFHSLPKDIQQRVVLRDFGSFAEMNQYVSQLRKMRQ